MSEIKGQLLGILLVITVFGTLVATLMPVFNAEIKRASDTNTGIENATYPNNAIEIVENDKSFVLKKLLLY